MKQKYIKPRISVEIVLFEHCIAAGSSVLNPGSPTAPFTPEVETWEEGGSDSRFIDI